MYVYESLDIFVEKDEPLSKIKFSFKKPLTEDGCDCEGACQSKTNSLKNRRNSTELIFKKPDQVSKQNMYKKSSSVKYDLNDLKFEGKCLKTERQKIMEQLKNFSLKKKVHFAE